jgi:hypothetical protein
MTNLAKRIDTDDLSDGAVSLDKLAQAVQDAISGGGGTPPPTTKGDLVTFDSAVANLGVGADGTVLTAASGEATGLKWVAPVQKVFSGVGSPNSAQTATVGSVYTDLTDTDVPVLYLKTTGSGNTGWIQYPPA